MDQITIAEKLTSLLIEEDPELRDVVGEFVEGLTQRIDELRAAHEQQDWDLLVTLAHRLKGAGGSYGYPDISYVGAEMERQFKAQQAANFSAFLEQLERIAKAATTGLQDAT